MAEWVNWSGSIRFSPRELFKPSHIDELADRVLLARNREQKIRIAGAGHSSSGLVESPDMLISIAGQQKLIRHDRENGTATFQCGVSIHQANQELQKIGLAIFNTGDVDVQMLAGAIATGTHGSGKNLQNLASILCGVKMVDGTGKIHDFNDGEHHEIMRGMRVSLGALGIFSEITIKVVPLFQLHRRDICVSIKDCLRYFLELASNNRNVDFYWYPRSDEAKIRILNEPGKAGNNFPFPYRLKTEEEGWVGDILPRKRELKFEEMEYAFPTEAGMKCFEVIRTRIKERHRKHVAWRVLVRIIAADDNYLSPHYGRESISISLHHNVGLPYEEYFNDIEPIFRDYGGRPHWAKKHSLSAHHMAGLYPEFRGFKTLRKQMDPDGVFMNSHLEKILETL